MGNFSGSGSADDAPVAPRGAPTYNISRAEEARLVRAYVSDKIRCEDVFDYYDRVPNGGLGCGSFGSVWRAENYDTGKIMAIKTIRNPGDKSLGREIKVRAACTHCDPWRNHLCAALDGAAHRRPHTLLPQVALEARHDNLLPVYEIYQQSPGAELHLVMDLVEPIPGLKQSDLFEWIVTPGKGALNTEDACKVLYQTASALKYLNDHKSIHRDLKPENMLIGKAFDRIYVMDYGLARCFMDDSIGSLDVVEATANIGSGGYQAPETITVGPRTQTATYGKACDVWSLGVILYICVRGKPPFGLGDTARKHDILKGKYSPMKDAKWNKVAPEFKELIDQMIGPRAVDPRRRLTVEDILSNEWVLRNAKVDPVQRALSDDLSRIEIEARPDW